MTEPLVCVIDRPDRAPAPTLDRLARRPGVQVLQPDQLEAIEPRAEVVYVRAGYWNDVDRLLDHAPGVRWIQVAMAGVDHLPTDRLAARGVTVTNSPGILDGAIAEFVVGSVLLWSKGLLVSAQQTRARRPIYRQPLANSELSALIIGAGGIGTATARALKQIGVGDISGVRRSLGDLDPVYDRAARLDDVLPRLAEFTVIVAALPATSQTNGLLGVDFCSRLGERAVFVNVGRGATVDNVALAEAMCRRPRSAAVLDVTDPEPLPEDHPLYECENVVISPHMSGDTAVRHEKFAAHFAANLDRYRAGDELVNVVSGPASAEPSL